MFPVVRRLTQVAVPLVIVSFALLFTSTLETPVSEITTGASTDSGSEARRHPTHQRPKPSVTAYYPYPYQVNNRPVRPNKFQAANQVYGFRQLLYPTFTRQQQRTTFEERRRSDQHDPQPQQMHQAEVGHAATFHAVNQFEFNTPERSHAGHHHAKGPPCVSHGATPHHRRPHPTCTVWPVGGGGAGSAGK